MKSEVRMEGGCLCGALRYQISGTPFEAEYCHCRMCQKSAGAVFINWMDFRAKQLRWATGKPSEYQSSKNTWRGFCNQCGSSLSFRDTRYPEYISLTIASLDNPNLVKPTRHIYTDSQVEWLTIEDDCNRYPQGSQKTQETQS
jgi:hypothetical protein